MPQIGEIVAVTALLGILGCICLWLYFMWLQMKAALAPGPEEDESGRNRGPCPNCGYDLRSGHDRCPECGASTELPSRPPGDAEAFDEAYILKNWPDSPIDAPTPWPGQSTFQLQEFANFNLASLVASQLKARGVWCDVSNSKYRGLKGAERHSYFLIILEDDKDPALAILDSFRFKNTKRGIEQANHT